MTHFSKQTKGRLFLQKQDANLQTRLINFLGGTDKLLHYKKGLWLYALCFIIIREVYSGYLPGSYWLGFLVAALLSLAGVFIVALAKEYIYDKYIGNGSVDVADVLATMLGAAAGVVASVLCVLLGQLSLYIW